MAESGNRGAGTQQGRQGFGGQPGQGKQGQEKEGQVKQGQGGVAGVLDTVRDQAQEVASRVGESAEQAWDSTRQGVQQMAGRVSETAGDAFGSLRGSMARYPFATLAVGFGLGMLVMMALDRNRRS
jgi:ElaB/YqjD/DUF883 family membrane-anchored ribosome-binding protein